MFQKVQMSGIKKTYAKERNVTTFSGKVFVWECRKLSLGYTSLYQKSSAIEKFHAQEGDITFLRWIYVTFTAYKVGWGTTLWSRIFGTSKTFMLSRGYRDSPLIFLASQYWNFSWVTPSTFQKFPGIETFHAWERKITFFSRKCLSHSWWKLLGTTSKFQKTWDLGNFHAYHGFPSFFCLSVPKNFVRNQLMFQKFSNVRYRKKFWMRTEYHDLHSKFFISQYAKVSWERLLRFKMFGISETFLNITFFPSIFLSHSSEKLREEPSNVSESSNVRYQKNLCKRTECHDFQWKSFCLRMP